MIHLTTGKLESDFHTTSDNGYDDGNRGFGYKTRASVIVFFICLVVLNSATFAHALFDHSYLNLKIKLEKSLYECHEIVNGKVVLKNHIPATYPGTFIIKIYKNNKLVRLLLTNIARIPEGETEFDLRTFGIKILETGDDAVGRWDIVVMKHGEKMIYGRAEYYVKAVQ